MQGFTLIAITGAETQLRCKRLQSQLTVKCRSRESGQDVCLNVISRTITMQGFNLTALRCAEKFTKSKNNET